MGKRGGIRRQKRVGKLKSRHALWRLALGIYTMYIYCLQYNNTCVQSLQRQSPNKFKEILEKEQTWSPKEPLHELRVVNIFYRYCCAALHIAPHHQQRYMPKFIQGLYKEVQQKNWFRLGLALKTDQFAEYSKIVLCQVVATLSPSFRHLPHPLDKRCAHLCLQLIPPLT